MRHRSSLPIDAMESWALRLLPRYLVLYIPTRIDRVTNALVYACPDRFKYARMVKGYSRSYAEDVTSVTSGASQGPHSFNLVFVCVFVCVTPGAIRI